MNVYLLPLLLVWACAPDKGEGDDTDTGADTVDTDTTDTDDTDDTDETDDTADTADTDAPGPEAPDGAALYTGTCAPCHGADGAGTGDYPDITGELDRTDAELIEIMIEGKDEMPPQPLSQEQAQAIVDWMRATF